MNEGFSPLPLVGEEPVKRVDHIGFQLGAKVYALKPIASSQAWLGQTRSKQERRGT